MPEGRTIALKVCGNRDNIAEVASLNPDYMGFIFYEPSPRCVGVGLKMPSDLPKSIKKVGVFVNEEVEAIKRIVTDLKLDFVQLHGQEPVEDCRVLKEFGVGVIKVFSVDTTFDFDATVPYEGVVDYFLFDTKGKFYGGNAIPFDWNLLASYHQRVPFFLGGGLTLENTSGIKMLSTMNLHAIDFNSGVEALPGLKNIVKIESVLEILNSKF
jgi:phosphoribosylanthranilate isomerase